MSEITILKPDDMHLHLRNDVRTAHAISSTAKNFARAIVMPNLKPPVTSVEQALDYKNYLEKFGADTNYLMSLYLTDSTTPETVEEVAKSPACIGFKLYPAGATTNSDSGVTSMEKIAPALEKMEELGVTLLIHGEVTENTDIFDREKYFIEQKLQPLLKKFPKLRVVCEHITTKEMTEFVLESPENVGATVTPQHMLINRNDIFIPGLNPHNFCLPVPKREIHRQAIVKAVLTGNQKFFAGTDSAPHLLDQKECACGCAGCYTSPQAVSLYAETFEQNGGLEKQKDIFENFMSKNGAKFYGLPLNTETITLKKEDWKIAASYQLEENAVLIPFWANKSLSWKLKA